MASANCSKHGTPLNGFGNYTFCNACDAEAAAPAPEGNSEYVTIYRHQIFTNCAPGGGFFPVSRLPHVSAYIPWRVLRKDVEETRDDGYVRLFDDVLVTKLITIYRAEGSSHPDLSFPSYSTKPVGAKTVPWRIPETAVEGGGKDYVLVEKGTIAEKVKE